VRFTLSLLDKMREHDALQQAQSEQSLSARALKQVVDFFHIEVPFSQKDPDYGLDWFNAQLAFPVHLLSQRIDVNATELFKGLIRTKLWAAYMDMLNTIAAEKSGLITTAFGTKLYIIHNAWSFTSVPGYPRLMMVAMDEATGITFESLESFLKCAVASGINL